MKLNKKNKDTLLYLRRNKRWPIWLIKLYFTAFTLEGKLQQSLELLKDKTLANPFFIRKKYWWNHTKFVVRTFWCTEEVGIGKEDYETIKKIYRKNAKEMIAREREKYKQYKNESKKR